MQSPARVTTDASSRRDTRGQVVVIFGGAMLLFVLLAALVIDLSWFWTNNLRIQRAADAAALAGVVFLPGDTPSAYAAARAEATKNGYTTGSNGFTVTPVQDPTNAHRLNVNITGPIGTYFARAVGINNWTASRDSKADYILPVPMGSPENYYGVFGMTRGLTSSETITTTIDNSQRRATGDCSNANSWPTSGCDGERPPQSGNATTGTWTATTSSGGTTITNSVRTNDNRYARSPSSGGGTNQAWWNFGLLSNIYDPPPGESIDDFAIQVRISDAFINTNCSGGNARIGVELSWNGGGNWTTQLFSNTLSTNTSSGDTDVGALGGSTIWGGHTWIRNDFSDANFRVRLTGVESCTGTKEFSVDRLETRVYYTRHYQTTTTDFVTTALTDELLEGPGSACTSGKAQCFEADGPDLNPRGFWGTLNTQGAENVNGDAYQPQYDTRTGGVSPACDTVTIPNRACYDPTNYYNYGVEMAPGSTNGAVYIYDPGFCDVNPDKGTGDRWFGGDAGVSTIYRVYNTMNTPRDLTDDVLLADSGSNFRQMDADDSTMNGNGGANECMYLADDTYGDGRDYHNRWFLLASGLIGDTNGTVYRVHTTSTDPANAGQQANTNGENSFAIYADAAGATPKVYGLGAMQAFTPLKASGSEVVSEFYLAQIADDHAGKTVEIHLWDPGDTRPLTANLQILIPTSGGWTPTNFSYTAAEGTSNSSAASCGSSAGTAVNQVQTNAGNTDGTYNGCWLIIRAIVPTGYSAPQDGWWKIRYKMTGTGTSNDVTTWSVNIIGNPVHLVLP